MKADAAAEGLLRVTLGFFAVRGSPNGWGLLMVWSEGDGLLVLAAFVFARRGTWGSGTGDGLVHL